MNVNGFRPDDLVEFLRIGQDQSYQLGYISSITIRSSRTVGYNEISIGTNTGIISGIYFNPSSRKFSQIGGQEFKIRKI